MIRFSHLALLLAACTPAYAEPTVSGLGHIKDGDSLMVGEREVRLFGIDAPEWDQSCKRNGKNWACGKAAAEELQKLIAGKQVDCVVVDIDEHNHAVARCSVGSADVNRIMVASGYATAYRHYSLDYVSAEESAKGGRRGIWAGTFQTPRDYRRSDEGSSPRVSRRAGVHRPVTRSITQVLPTGACTIKGNQGSNGWIYHLPGTPSYDRTKPEQMFCSESDAQAAGYRRAKVR